MRAEFLDLQPLGRVPSVFFCGVTRYTWRAFGVIGPAFGALESDHDPDALVFSHKDVAPYWRVLEERMIVQGCPPF